MHFLLLSAVLAGLLLPSFCASAQSGKVASNKGQSNKGKSNNNTLLWRISGKGLRQQSYLFGTYHTRDPRAFQFTDSMVKAFRTSAAFFGELHLDSAARDYYQHHLSEAPIDIAALFASALSGNIYPTRQTPLPWGATPFGGEDDTVISSPYPVFLDAWLFRHAQLQGKQVGGLEELSAQLGIFTPDPKFLRRDTEATEENAGLATTFLRYMREGQMEFYQNQDLESIEQTTNWVKELQGGKRVMEKMLDDRNVGMVARIDSLVRLAPSFITLGCAHLLGKKGVVALLRKKGYTITPIHSPKSGATVAASSTSLTRPDWNAYSLFGGETSAELPIEPVAFAPDTRPMGAWSSQLTIAPDVGAGINYFLAKLTLPPHQLVTNWPTLMRACLAILSDSSNQLVVGQVIPADTADGQNAMANVVAVTAASQRLRARLLMRGDQLYLLAAGSDVDLPSDSSVERLFRSFRLAPIPESRWETLTFDTGRCAVRFPSNRHSFSVALGTTTTPQQGAAAQHDGTTFTITVEHLPNYVPYQGDLANMVWTILGLRGSNHLAVPEIVHDSGQSGTGIAQLWFSMQVPGGSGGMRGTVLRDGTFEYLLTASHPTAMPVQASVDSFFSSFQSLPLAPLPWQTFSSYVLGFKVNMPGKASISDQSESRLQHDEATIVALDDTLNGGEYEVRSLLLNPYLQLPNLDSLFQREVSYSFTRDMVLSSGAVATSSGVAGEYIYGKPQGVAATRYRLVQQGRRAFLLSYFGNQGRLRDSSVERFFSSFQPLGETEQWELSADKVPQLLADIFLETEAGGRARDLMNKYKATNLLGVQPRHLPLVYGIIDSLLAVGDFVDDADSVADAVAVDDENEVEEDALGGLVSWLQEVHDTLTPQFLKERYGKFPSNSTKGALISTLLQIGSEESLHAAAELLQQHRQDSITLESLAWAGIDSGTTGAMYPGILSLAEMKIYQEDLYVLTSRALGKKLISANALLPHRDVLVSNFCSHIQELATLENSQEKDENQRWDLRWKLLQLMDCLGYLPAAADLDSLLRECAATDDIRLSVAASIALLRHGEEVHDTVLQAYAAAPENRLWLYRQMEGYGIANHFPAKFQNRASFAESSLAEWFEMEDGVPTIIELLGERAIRWKESESTCYLFRYTWDSTAADATWGSGVVIVNPATQPDLEPTVSTDYDSLEELTDDEKIRYFLMRESPPYSK